MYFELRDYGHVRWLFGCGVEFCDAVLSVIPFYSVKTVRVVPCDILVLPIINSGGRVSNTHCIHRPVK